VLRTNNIRPAQASRPAGLYTLTIHMGIWATIDLFTHGTDLMPDGSRFAVSVQPGFLLKAHKIHRKYIFFSSFIYRNVWGSLRVRLKRSVWPLIPPLLPPAFPSSEPTVLASCSPSPSAPATLPLLIKLLLHTNKAGQSLV